MNNELMPDKLTTDDIGLYIYATMPDGSRNMMFDIRVRGWGNLTGGGARNMSEADAIKVQKMWADEMCKRWNEADRAAPSPVGDDKVYRIVDLSVRKPDKMGWYNFVSSSAKPSNLGCAFYDGKAFNFNKDGFYSILQDGHTAFWLEEVISTRAPAPKAEEDAEDKLDRIMEASHEPEKSGDDAVIAHAIECCAAWEPAARIIGNVRAGDLGRILRKFRTPTPLNAVLDDLKALYNYALSYAKENGKSPDHLDKWFVSISAALRNTETKE